MRAAVFQAAVTGGLVGPGTRSSAGWERRSLAELLEAVHAGKSFKCEERPAREDEWGVIKVSAMTWGQFREQENKTVAVGRAVDERMEIRPGDLLVSRANTVDYVGAVVHVGACRPRLLLSDKSLRLVPATDVLPEWLVIALRSPDARRQIEAAATGTSDSMRNISQPKLKAVAIPMPPLAIQRAVAQEVSRLTSLIDGLEATVLTNVQVADALCSSILADACSGKLVSLESAAIATSPLPDRIAAGRTALNGAGSTPARHSRVTT
jgi:type I restriction enzyme S subunit